MVQSKDALFSTYDSDNDNCGNHNCAMEHRGGWWYNPYAITDDMCSTCDRGGLCDQFSYSKYCGAVCARSNLNGVYNGVNGENIFWDFSKNCNLRSVEIKLRPHS